MPTQFHVSSDYQTGNLRGCHTYVLPDLLYMCSRVPAGARLLDVGCGNGSVAGALMGRGYRVVGVDLDPQGIQMAKQCHPAGRFEQLPADRDILENLHEKPFDVVYSLEVIEHLYDPKAFIAGCFAALKSGGIFICSTPYHGYLKNLMLSLTNHWDKHANPLFDGGHIKLFSRHTLSSLLEEGGFRDLEFRGSGRLPYMWKSMVMSAIKPEA